MLRTWLWLALFALVGTTACSHGQTLAIVNARVVVAPDAEPIGQGVVLVRDGRIAAAGTRGELQVPAGAQVVDAAGGTVVAGFWNNHVHLIQPPLADAAAQPAAALSRTLSEQYLRWGFTTIFDLSSAPGNAIALRARIAGGEVVGPSILAVDAPFFPEGGTPAYVSDGDGSGWSPRDSEVATPAQAAERAKRQLDAGADGLKIFAGAIVGGEIGVLPMDVEVARAVTAAAHAAGRPVFAHPSDLAGLQVVLDSGADILAHTAPMAGPLPAELLRRLVAADVALVPSLKLFEIELEKEGAPAEVSGKVLATAKGQLAAFSEAGGTVLFGTDAGYVDWYDTRDELRLMREAGLDWRRILASLTVDPARRFGQDEARGRIAPGMVADLVVLAGDPSVDVAAFADVRYTIREGELVYRSGDAAHGD